MPYGRHSRRIRCAMIHHHDVLEEVTGVSLPPGDDHPCAIVVPHHRALRIARKGLNAPLELPQVLIALQPVCDDLPFVLLKEGDLQRFHVETDICQVRPMHTLVVVIHDGRVGSTTMNGQRNGYSSAFFSWLLAPGKELEISDERDVKHFTVVLKDAVPSLHKLTQPT